MEPNYWQQRWQSNRIGFHALDVNPMLVTYFKALSLKEDKRIFIPLCGKTRDIFWLLSNGCMVVGAELSEIAVAQLFIELEIEPQISDVGNFKLYNAENIDIFIGDIFDLSENIIGHVDAVYDRAALVALPAELRARYAPHIIEISGGAPHLLLCFEYDQTLMDGPPFSVGEAEVTELYRDKYRLKLLARDVLPGGLKGKHAAKECAWLLR